MTQQAILVPFFATMTLTFVVWIYMFGKRIPFIQSSGLTPEDLATPGRLLEVQPAEVSNPSDNLKNLFEMPVLFYGVVLALFAAGWVDAFYVACAWTFFAFRCLHSLVHCTFNHVMLRFSLYLVSCLALAAMVLRVLLASISAA